MDSESKPICLEDDPEYLQRRITDLEKALARSEDYVEAMRDRLAKAEGMMKTAREVINLSIEGLYR